MNIHKPECKLAILFDLVEDCSRPFKFPRDWRAIWYRPRRSERMDFRMGT